MMRLKMFKNTFFPITIGIVLVMISCGNGSTNTKHELEGTNSERGGLPTITIGANQTENYLQLLKDKRVGIVGNQSSVIFNNGNYTHLVDSLLSLSINVKKVFSPEHGFRGTAYPRCGRSFLHVHFHLTLRNGSLCRGQYSIANIRQAKS